jgi:predicted outer membrane repeat protein
LAVLFIIIGLITIERPVYAAGVVSTCNEANLATAISGGGNVTFTCSGTIVLTSQITISADTTIDGIGQSVTISGNNTVRLFSVNAATTLTLNNLILTQGSATLVPSLGGAIYNQGTLDIIGCTFSNNSASSWGGAIYSIGTAVNITNSVFSGNSASGGGAMLLDGGTLDISGSTFSGNNATTAAGAGALELDGGNVTIDKTSFLNNSAPYFGAIDHNYGTLTITNSTFSGNQAANGEGGAIDENNVLVLANSTFSGNSSTTTGGAIVFYGESAMVTNCTFAGNSASRAGGAIYVGGGTITLINTIVADSSAGGNCGGRGTITDGGNNLQFGGTVVNSCGATIPTPGSDPLGSNILANNGGPTQTIALSAGSAAIDAGNDTTCATIPVGGVDQRGVTRPQGPHCDIGAYELIQQQPPTAVPTITEWGMIIFMILAGVGSVYYIRKQKRTQIQ